MADPLPDVVGHVGDGDDHAEAAIRKVLGPHRVVVVARIGRVDRDQVVAAQVLAPAPLLGRHLRRQRARLVDDLVRELLDDAAGDL